MKYKLDKQYLKVSLYTVFTFTLIYVIGLSITFIGPIMKFFTGFLSTVLKVLTPLIIGFVISYIIDPLVGLYENSFKKIKIKNKLIFMVNKKRESLARKLATFFTYLNIVAFITLFVIFFSYSITKEVSFTNLDETLKITSNYLNSFGDTLKNLEHTLQKYNIESKTIEENIAKITTGVIKFIQNVGNGILGFIMNITGHLSNLFFAIIISIYLTLDKERFIGYWRVVLRALFSENKQKKITSFGRDIDKIFSGYIRGQLTDAVLMIFIISVVLSLIGIKFAVIIGIVAGIANLIPYFGPIVAYAGAISMGLLSGDPTKTIIAIIALAIVQQIDGSIIGPRLLGNSLNLHPLFVLLAVIIGGSLYGIMGMLLAVPVAALIKLIFKRFIDDRLKDKEEIN